MADQSDDCEPISCWPPLEHDDSDNTSVYPKERQACDPDPVSGASKRNLDGDPVKKVSDSASQNPCDKKVKHGTLSCSSDEQLPAKKRKQNIDEPLANIALARWWRSQGRLACSEEIDIPLSRNPNTILRYAARSRAGVTFLKREVRRLTLLLRTGIECAAGLHAAIGTFHEKLNNYGDAEIHLNQAVEMDPTNKEFKWLLHRVTRQRGILIAQETLGNLISNSEMETSMPVPVQVERREASQLTVDDFMHEYALHGKPVVITGLVEKMTSVPWSLDHIQRIAGECQVMLKHHVPGSAEWAQLEDSHTTTVSQFIDILTQTSDKGECSDYLFDWSLPIHCPKLAEELTIPQYFAGDFLKCTSTGSLYHDSWPSLFIAPGNLHSELHVDAFGSNFWMALFTGRKRWLFFLRKDLPLLYPTYEHSMDPVFEVDLSNPDLKQYPLLGLTQPRECILEPGELLFVPAGCPHRVETLETSVAISANYVDMSNVDLVKSELKINALIDDRADSLLRQVDILASRTGSTTENQAS